MSNPLLIVLSLVSRQTLKLSLDLMSTPSHLGVMKTTESLEIGLFPGYLSSSDLITPPLAQGLPILTVR